MLPPLACMTALAVLLAPAPASGPVATPPPAGSAAPAVPPASEPAEPARDYLVRIDVGPELARRMGLKAIVRPAGENFGNRRAARALDLPRPATSDDAPAPASLKLPAGLWRI
jgi:hypothetical protein